MNNNQNIVNINVSRKKNWLFNLLHAYIPRKRDKKTWIFASSQGKYIDNSKYLFEYVSNNEKGINAYYFVNSQELIDNLSKHGYKAVLSGSKEANKLAKKAGVSFYTHGIDDFGEHIYNYNSYMIALWHGVGFKEMYYADRNFKDNIVKKLYRNLFSYVHRDLTITTSEYGFEGYRRDFRLKKGSQYEIIGQPRNDIFFENKPKTIEPNKKIILYAPTYRKNTEHNKYIKFFISYFESKDGQKFLKDNGYVLYIRLHPLTYDVPFEENEYIVDGKKYDGQELLLECDTLITDYSSIATDFAITQRKIIIYTPDYEEYIKQEPLFKEADLIYKNKNVCEDVNDILNKIKEDDLSITEEFNKLFNTDLTGHYSKKIVDCLKKRLNINL